MDHVRRGSLRQPVSQDVAVTTLGISLEAEKAASPGRSLLREPLEGGDGRGLAEVVAEDFAHLVAETTARGVAPRFRRPKIAQVQIIDARLSKSGGKNGLRKTRPP